MAPFDLLVVLVLIAAGQAFRPLFRRRHASSATAIWCSGETFESAAAESSTGGWQEDVEKILDIDSSCDDRKMLVEGLRSKFGDIQRDVQEAVRERDLQKVAPKDTKYGKDIRGFLKFREQMRNDILPEIINKGVPSLFASGPRVAQQALQEAGGPAGLAKQAQEAVEKINEISQDPSALQYTLDEVRREVKNIVKSTPEGLDSPEYEILKKTDDYEIREYASYSVVSTSIESNEEMAEETMASGKGFNKLARYVLEGENSEEEKMSMTTPVITNRDTMAFVMPSGISSDSAPKPTDPDLKVTDVPKQLVAVREFTGLVTDKESAKQRAALEDSLLADGVEFDNLSFKTLQYNPPYALPWVRRNEVTLVVKTAVEEVEDAQLPQASAEQDTEQGTEQDTKQEEGLDAEGAKESAEKKSETEE